MNQPASLLIEKRYRRCLAVLGRNSLAICRPRKSFFHKLVFDTSLPASKTTAVCNLPFSIRFEQRTSRYYIFCCIGTSIQSAYIESFLGAQNRCLLFKGPGSFKKKIFGGNVEEAKAYQLIPLTPPLLFILQYL